MTASNVSLPRGRSRLRRLLCGNFDNKVSRPDTSDRTSPVTQRYGSEARRKVERPVRCTVATSDIALPRGSSRLRRLLCERPEKT